MKGECSGRPKAFGQHCAASRGECYLAIGLESSGRTKQGIVPLPKACIKGAIKQKVLLMFNRIHVAMATDALTCGSAGEGLADKYSAI